MSDFKVKFRGVRGSYPVANKNYLEYGGNTSCVEVNVGGHLIILDAGTGIIDLGNELAQTHIRSASKASDRVAVVANIFITHMHHDHLLGLPFFVPLHFADTKINVFGGGVNNESLEETLSEVVFGKTFPLNMDDLAARMQISELSDVSYVVLSTGKEPQVFDSLSYNPKMVDNDDVVVSCFKSYAHPQCGVFIYKIEYRNKCVVYATDKESYVGGDKKLMNFAKDCDLLIHDSQYTDEDYMSICSPKQGFGHSTFAMALDAQNQLNAKKLAFFHYEPTYDDNKLDEISSRYCKENVIMPKEELELEIL